MQQMWQIDQLAVGTPSSSNDDNLYGVDEDDSRIFSMMEVNKKIQINKKSIVKKRDFVTERINELYTTTFAVNDVIITFEIDTESAISAMPCHCFISKNVFVDFIVNDNG